MMKNLMKEKWLTVGILRKNLYFEEFMYDLLKIKKKDGLLEF